MKTDQVVSVFKAFIAGDRERAVSGIRCIEAHERAQGNLRVAEQLQRCTRSMPHQMIRLDNAPKQLSMKVAEKTLSELILSADNESAVERLLLEWKNREKLREANLPPRSVGLLSGPSGNGKTSLAEAIANALQMHFAFVPADQIIESHMGASSVNLSKAMSFAREQPCVLFFDEADSFVSSRRRSDNSAGMENNRLVNQVLTGLDQIGTLSLVLFATNFSDALDSAFVRRATVRLELDAPDEAMKRRMANRMNQCFPMIKDTFWDGDLSACNSFAAIEALAMDMARACVLGVESEVS